MRWGIFCSTYDTEDTVDIEDIQLKKAIEESLWSEHVRKHDERQQQAYIESFERNRQKHYREGKYHSDDDEY